MEIREARTHEELDEVAQIQREVWNAADIDVAGRIHLRATQHAGGSVLIGLDAGVVAGFAYAFPAFHDREAYWHSDMLAVRPAYRGTGLGQALKWAQRTAALGHGIDRITWTFDPMQARNAHLNLTLLGATAREYLRNFYGVTTSDLHHGLPTDRLLASWNLRSPRVEALAGGEKAPEPGASAGSERVVIPADWNALVAREPEQARREQARVADALSSAFARGLAAVSFLKTDSAYLLASS